MRVRCAWCQKLLGEKRPQAVDKSSHTICLRCLRLNLGLPAEGEPERLPEAAARSPAEADRPQPE